MSEQGETPPAGWYNDPTTANQQRWWDGTQWDSATRPLTDGPPLAAPLAAPVVPPVAAIEPSDWTTPAMPPPMSPTGDQPKRSARRLFLIAGACVVVLGGCVTVLAAGSDAPDASEATVDEAGPPETIDEADEAEAAPGDEDDLLAPLDADDIGSRQDPLPYEEPIDLTWSTVGDADGSVWTTTIGRPRDITDAVLAANEFNDPPPEGVRFVGFEAKITLVEAEVEPLAPSFNFSWEILGGSTARVYNSTTIDTESFGCGVTPNDFDDFAEVFAGGTLSGTVCIPVPVEDLDHPDTRVALRFADGNRAIFGP